MKMRAFDWRNDKNKDKDLETGPQGSGLTHAVNKLMFITIGRRGSTLGGQGRAIAPAPNIRLVPEI